MDIAISGAGIAGPTLAYWLLRAGHVPVLVERAPAFRDGGYVIDFWGVGYEVARRMGLESAVREAGYAVRALRAVDKHGAVRAELDTQVFQRATGGAFTSLPRGDLARLLYDSVADRVETRFGDGIAAIAPDGDGLQVTFDRGDARRFDLVVGADGLHSNVRRLAFGEAAGHERYLGCRVAACVVEGYRPRDELVYVTHNVPGRQVGRFALRGDRTLFLFVFRADGAPVPDDPAVHKAILRREYAQAGWECPAILQAVDATDALYFDVVSQVRLPCWSRGRVALVGDAAACASLLAGEGSGLAMTEAYVLAWELSRAQGDWRRAYAAYESRLKPFILRKQAAARRFIGFFAARTRLGLWLRDLGLRAANTSAIAALFAARGLRDDFALPGDGADFGGGTATGSG